MRRSRSIAAATAVLSLVACGAPTGTPEAIPQAEVPEALREVSEATEPPSATEPPQEQVTIWFSRDDRLVASLHRVPDTPTVTSAIEELLRGPSEADRERGLRTTIADPEAVGAVSLARGTAAIELTTLFTELPASDQVFAIAQIVLTATDLRGVGRVRFLLDGQEVAVPLPDGTTSTETVSRDDYLSLTASG